MYYQKVPSLLPAPEAVEEPPVGLVLLLLLLIVDVAKDEGAREQRGRSRGWGRGRVRGLLALVLRLHHLPGSASLPLDRDSRRSHLGRLGMGSIPSSSCSLSHLVQNLLRVSSPSCSSHFEASGSLGLEENQAVKMTALNKISLLIRSIVQYVCICNLDLAPTTTSRDLDFDLRGDLLLSLDLDRGCLSPDLTPTRLLDLVSAT